MKNTTGTYQTKEIGKRFFVIFKFNDGEEMAMTTKSYATESGANKRMVSIKQQAGV